MHVDDLRDAYKVNEYGQTFNDAVRTDQRGVHLHFEAQRGQECDWCHVVQGDESSVEEGEE